MANVKSNDRLYQDLARALMDELASGRYPVGTRLPAERDLAVRFEVSRPTVREAIIALEVQGLVEVRIGSGAYVKRLPGEEDRPGFNVTAFELTEARLLFEGEAAALAATQVTDEDVAAIEVLVQRIAEENQDPNGTESADREFHLAIARATRNVAVYQAIERLWDLRATSPEAALLHEKARHAQIKPVVEEHTAVLEALKARDPNAARAAMRAHLSAVLDGLLFATEERALAEARKATQAKRARYAGAMA
ncbi:FadR/GntR family transcriptional regulator [Novosphingobium jiangmenense]|uniref:FadR family transcriptional regulator n=1 Tax=Novosphingobium jiangmenense TaxID=2791981 RepID=A0ABS0HM80_9SPHN|nr:FadR/GntR family transcriptional regulator [Novosphingobium jiangmenense]MBF9153099.1 FadR family transcriptional regulator [Novosphingobium jiangmenense]